MMSIKSSIQSLLRPVLIRLLKPFNDNPKSQEVEHRQVDKAGLNPKISSRRPQSARGL